MKNYISVNFKNTKNQNDLLVAFLSEINFDSFEEVNENHLIAYVEEENFDESGLKTILKNLSEKEDLQYTVSKLENKNWNEEWEKNFQPIVVNNKCSVRASFHPPQNTEHEIIIEPKMAFGTGHHATTEMMIATMLELPFKGEKVLDFGCGTAILSILAEKLGAVSIFANDIEEPAYDNSLLNASINGCDLIKVAIGGIEVVPKEKFGIILANVNTNAILHNSSLLVEKLASEGVILFSGILVSDKETIKEMARTLNLEILNIKEKNNWLLFLCKKKN